MIQAGQRVRFEEGDVTHIVETPDPYATLTLCGESTFWATDLSPDPTLPLCATCARRKDTT